MGYYTDYFLSLVEGPEEEFDIMLDTLKSEYDMDFSEGLVNAKWYRWAEDMESVSKRYPNVLVELSGSGEEQDDIWLARFKNGDSEIQTAIIPPFKKLIAKSETKKYIRIFWPDSQKYTEVGIPDPTESGALFVPSHLIENQI